MDGHGRFPAHAGLDEVGHVIAHGARQTGVTVIVYHRQRHGMAIDKTVCTLRLSLVETSAPAGVYV
jgi:hypothetical protein